MASQARHRIKRIRISNVLGIDELEVEPGAVTVIEGANATGKTSFVSALKAIVSGGHDASLIRNGADVAEAVIVLDDDTEIRRRITRNGSYLDISDVDRSPQTWLNEQLDGMAVNPIRFLDAKPKEQARMLLEAMPVEVSAGELREAIGTWAAPDLAADEPVDGHGVEVIDLYRKSLYDERTGINRLAREHEATVKQLEGAVPVVNANIDHLAEVIEKELGELESETDQFEKERRELQDGLRERHRAAVDKVTTEANDRIAELAQKIREIEQERDQTVAQYATILADRKVDVDKNIDRRAAHNRERIAELRGQAARNADARRTRETLDDQRAKLTEAKEQSDRLTEALGNLDALKDRLLERLPIRGITVRDGVLYRGDVPFSRLNRAEQVKAALRLAQIRAGDIPIVCADGMEALDPETFDAFVAEAREQDVHLFMTRVTTDPQLTVRTESEKVSA